MPGLIAVACDMLGSVEIAEDETVIGELFVNLRPDVSVFYHILVLYDILAVYNKIQVESKYCVVLGIARLCDGFRRVISAVFLGEFIHNPLLLLNASARGIEVYINILFFEVSLKLEICVVCFFLNFDLILDRVGHCNCLEVFLPVIGELVRLVDNRHIVNAVDFRVACGCCLGI